MYGWCLISKAGDVYILVEKFSKVGDLLDDIIMDGVNQFRS